MEVEIQGITHDGQGVARIEGKVCFVPRALPGERAVIEVVAAKKKYMEGKMLQLTSPSLDRIPAACCRYDHCGGCAFQHVPYENELSIKEGILRSQLKKIGEINDPPLLPILPSPKPKYYRNKVTWQVQEKSEGTQIGFYSTDHHTVLNVNFCRLVARPLLKASEVLREFLGDTIFCGNIVLQQGDDRIAVMLQSDRALNLDWSAFLQANPQFVHLSVWVKGEKTGQWGEEYLSHTLRDLTFYNTPECFFQVNSSQTPVLYQVIEDFAALTKETRLLDAYCGVGAIGLWLARQAGFIVGLEQNPKSIEMAKLNAKKNMISNAAFYTGACEAENIKQLILKYALDTVILDPARSGLKPQIINTLAQNQIDTVIYVSCNPATFARDLKRFCAAGYHIEKIQPVDMFPWTYHIEAVGKLSLT